MPQKSFSELKQMYREGEFAIRYGLVYLEPRHVVEHRLEQEELAELRTENARLTAELAEARGVLLAIWDMAQEDVREGTEGTMTAQIEADARAYLKPTP